MLADTKTVRKFVKQIDPKPLYHSYTDKCKDANMRKLAFACWGDDHANNIATNLQKILCDAGYTNEVVRKWNYVRVKAVFAQ